MLHGHGDDAYKHGGAVRLNFSSNVRPGGAPVALREFLATRIADIGTYPEVAAETLTERLAEHLLVAPDNIIVTNGAVAGIHLIAQAWPRARSTVVIPAFAEYEDACRLHGHRLDFAPWGASAYPDAELVWVCNPNNPTGGVLSRDAVLALVDRHPATVFVLDQAYADFCAAEPTRPEDAVSRENLILVRSMTKTYGLPGLRLGYIVAPEPLRRRLAGFLQPWSVNTLALAAGIYCLDHADQLALPRDVMLSNAVRLAVALGNVPDIEVHPGATTFVLFKLAAGLGGAARLKTRLVHDHGLLVRDASNFRGLGPGAVRVATQDAVADGRLVDAVRAYVAATIASRFGEIMA